MGDEEQIDHAAAGVPARQVLLQHLPGFGVFGPREQAVAVDRTPQGLRFAPQGVDDMVVVADMDPVSVAASAGPGMGYDEGAAKKRLNAIILEVDTQALADQLRWSAVEDALDQEAACAGDRHHDLGEVCCAPLWQGLQVGPFRLNRIGPLTIASRRRRAPRTTPPRCQRTAGSPRCRQSRGCPAGSAPA
jgi:hypothetical protein